MDDRQLLYVYWIILAVFAFTSISLVINKAANDEGFKEKAMVSDLAITLDSVISSPSDILIEKNIGKYEVSMDNNCEFYTESESKKADSMSYRCISTKGIIVQSFSSLTGNLCISKINNEVIVKKCSGTIS